MTANGSELTATQAALRFLIELAALVGWGVVGRRVGSGLGGDALGWALAIVLPVVAATVWGAFRAPGDHSAGGAPVSVAGPVRLLIEAVVLAAAAIALLLTDHVIFGTVLAGAIAVHYAATTARVRWLLTIRTATSD